MRFGREDDDEPTERAQYKTVGHRKQSGPLLYKMCKTESRLIRRVLEHHGFQETEGSDWNLMWMGVHLKPYMMQGMNKYQKVNHFPRTYELTRKDKMYQNIAKMRDKYGAKHWDFCPKTFNMPYEWNLFIDDYNKDPGDGVWIIKPNASSRGRGIHLVSHPGEVSRDDSCVVSRYVANPLLIDGFKFDLRIYVLVTSFDPLRVYIFQEGLARFATEKYDRHSDCFERRNMHLTNYSINKTSRNFVKNEDADADDCGHKWSMTALRRRLHEMNIDVEALWEDIHELVLKTLISVESTVVPGLKTFVPHVGNCFELLGFDVLISEDLKPWLVEVNLSPSLGTDSPLDRRIKNKLVANMFDLVGIQHYDREQARSDAALARQKRERAPTGRPMSASCTSRGRGEQLSAEAQEILQQTKDEYHRRGQFIRVFPCRRGRQYLRFFEIQRAHNAMLLDLVTHDPTQFDERPYQRELSELGHAAVPPGMSEAISDVEDDEEVLIEEDEEEGEEGWGALGEDEHTAKHPGEEDCSPNDNLYARRAVEEYLGCLLERLGAQLKHQGRPKPDEHRTAQQLNLVADQTLAALGSVQGDEQLATSGRIAAVQTLLRQYRERSRELEAQQPGESGEALESAAHMHLTRFRQELRLASVDDLGRFLKRFVGEMPRVATKLAKARPQTGGACRRPLSPQFPGQQTRTKTRPHTVGPGGRGSSSTTQPASPTADATTISRGSVAASCSSSGVRKLFIGHQAQSRTGPVILSNSRSAASQSMQAALYGSKSSSRPMSAGSTTRRKKPLKSEHPSLGLATSFAERIRTLTTQAQLHPRSGVKAKRPQSAKFSK